MRRQDLLLLFFSCGAAAAATLAPAPGACAPVINEFVARPRAGEGEWVELFNPGLEDVDLAGWTIADGTGRARALPARLRLNRGEFLVLAARPESLRVAYALADSVRVVRPAGWPILNDHDGARGAPADVIVVADGTGATVDSLAYFEAWLPGEGGRSLERVNDAVPATEAGNWGWSQDPEGATPGRANSLAPRPGAPLGGALEGPDEATPARRPAVFDYRLPGPGTMALWLLDEAGREVAVLRAPASSPAVGRWVWGSDAPRPPRSGVYFVCLRWRGEGSSPVRACHALWVTP